MSSQRVLVSGEDRAVLESWLRAGTMQAGLVQRARIVLLSADGLGTGEVMERVGASRPTVIAWRNRWAGQGLAGLTDKPRSGRPPVIDELAVVVETLNKPPAALGVTHWSSRLLAKHLGISDYSVVMIWQKYDLQPWKSETFKFSTDPELDAKVRDIVGLYMDPPLNAVVVCVDEKTQIQALDRTAPTLPMTRGRAERMTHDYKRNGTTSLFAGLDIATGKSPEGATTGTPTPSSWTSSRSSRRPTRGASCTWCATTTPPTSTPTLPRGWRRTPGSPCISPPPAGHG